VVLFIKTVSSWKRQGTWMTRRENQGVPGIFRVFATPSRPDGAAPECHRICQQDHLAGSLSSSFGHRLWLPRQLFCFPARPDLSNGRKRLPVRQRNPPEAVPLSGRIQPHPIEEAHHEKAIPIGRCHGCNVHPGCGDGVLRCWLARSASRIPLWERQALRPQALRQPLEARRRAPLQPGMAQRPRIRTAPPSATSCTYPPPPFPGAAPSLWTATQRSPGMAAESFKPASSGPFRSWQHPSRLRREKSIRPPAHRWGRCLG